VNVVFCVTCKDRAFHLAQTLPRNLQDNPRSKFVVLDYGSARPLQFEPIMPPEGFDPSHLVLYRYETDGPFRMAHAKNMAHRLGILEGGEILVNVDADNFLHAGYEDFVEAAMRGSDRFIWSGFVKGKGRKLRGVSGRIAVTREAFIKTGGYDEARFAAWGHDDTDFNARLQFLGYKGIETPIDLLECIPHGDGLRFKDYPDAQPADPDAYDRPPPRPRCGIVNFGNVGVGEVTKVGDFGVRLYPIPTRIFGIGLHKTATTSLDAALRILGYESAHWPSGAWARQVWDQMRGHGTSPTLERSYAASDLPISILYRELDKAYPGSKFILTVRDEVDWLRSVRDHFSEKNRFKWEWGVYPFSNRIHRAVYGRTDFDLDGFLERYRRHNAEVQEYFRDRPNDLFVMRGEPGWKGLCSFLGKPEPQFNYPRQFITRG
jgi:sulfotransferase family protein/glycosyl transferase family 7 (putative galactosyltransferase)